MDASRLKLNEEKTQFMWVGNARNLEKLDITSIQLESTNVSTSEVVRDLGVMIG